MSIIIKKNKIAEHNGHDIIEYQLISPKGFQVNVLNFGCIISKIFTHDKNGTPVNVITGFEGFDPLNPHYAGAIIGRFSGRISNGFFMLDNQIYCLRKNTKSGYIHGGYDSLDKQIWTVNELSDGLELSYFSCDGESGFPANVNFTVKYQIINDNSLRLSYFATSDVRTVVNLTNHCYFDLSLGVAPMEQLLRINADSFGEIEVDQVFYSNLKSVENTPFDFRKPKPIIQDINQSNWDLGLAHGYDHPFVLNSQENAIQLSSPISGIQLNISTTDPVCVFYSGNYFTPHRGGVCLETQYMPNAVNQMVYQDDVIVSPNKPYKSITTWSFTCA